jgi:hypothetical protein
MHLVDDHEHRNTTPSLRRTERVALQRLTEPAMSV